MFLDLKSSTSVAEELGHVRYFAFLNDFFKDLTEPILATHGVIYQYVGDEIVISWTPHEGLKGDRCIRCFFECRTAIESRASYYRHVYGVVPAFRAGMHIGRATVGEVGSMKKEIVFSGDALNTCARIQSLCKEHEKDLLVSGELADALTEAGGEVAGENMGEVSLRGRRRPVRLVAIAT